ncbi:MAG: hypothetical protein EPN91_07260 [Salinibacterium sp.]|nr:MAG: hypothetical protein EPN91_07260 [Salinibacterium sp.]
MTAIAGIVHKGTVYIGGDSAGVDSGLSLVVRADAKVFVNGPMVLGFTSSFRMGQLLRYAFTPPPCPKRADVHRYMVTDFIDAVRKTLKKGGYAKIENKVEEGGTFLVGFRGRLFEINGDFQVGEGVDPYGAVGIGRDLVLGALFASEGRAPEERIHTALAAAERFGAAVRAPFTVVKEP